MRVTKQKKNRLDMKESSSIPFLGNFITMRTITAGRSNGGGSLTSMSGEKAMRLWMFRLKSGLVYAADRLDLNQRVTVILRMLRTQITNATDESIPDRALDMRTFLKHHIVHHKVHQRAHAAQVIPFGPPSLNKKDAA